MIHHVNSFIIRLNTPIEVPFITTAITHQILPGATLSSDHRDAMLNIAIEQSIRQLNPGGMTGAMVAVAGAAINNCSIIEIQLSDYIIQELVLNNVFNIIMYGVPKAQADLREYIDPEDSTYPIVNIEGAFWPHDYVPAYKHPIGWYTNHLSFIFNSIAFFASYFSLVFARNHKFMPSEKEIEDMYYAKMPLFWMLFFIYFSERIRIFQYFVPVPCLAYGFGIYYHFQLEGVVPPPTVIDNVSQQQVAEKPFHNYQTIYTKYGSHTVLMATIGEEISKAFVKNGIDPFETFLEKFDSPDNIIKTEDIVNTETDTTVTINITAQQILSEIQSFHNICNDQNIAWLWSPDSNDEIKLQEGILVDSPTTIYDDYTSFKAVADDMWKAVQGSMNNIFKSASEPVSSIACVQHKTDTGVWGTVTHDILLYDTFGDQRLFKRGYRPDYPENHDSHWFWELKTAGNPVNLSNTSMNYDQSQLFPDGMVLNTVEEAIAYHVMNCCPYYVSLNRLTCAQGKGGFSVWGKGPIYTATLVDRIPGMYYKHKAEVIIQQLMTSVLKKLGPDDYDNSYNILGKTSWINGF